jgi:hypothetical protein
VADAISMDARTALASPKSAATSINSNISRAPNLQWTMDPVHTPDQVRALQLAYHCVLTGIMFSKESTEGQLLRDFNAYDDLQCLLTQLPQRLT